MRRDDSASQLLFHGNALPMWIAAQDTHRILDVNDAAVKAYGHPREAFIGMPAEQLMPAGESPCMICKPDLPLPVRSGPWTHLRADGSPMEVEVTAQSMRYDGHPAVLATIHDLTDQRRIQGALLDSEQLFHKLVEASPLGVYLIQGGRVVYANPAMLRFTGYGPADLEAGLRLMDLVAPEDRARVEDAYRRRMEGDDSLRHHALTCLRKDGTRCPVEVHATLTRYRGTTTLLGMALDLSERLATQEALERGITQARAVSEAAQAFAAAPDEGDLARLLLQAAAGLAPALAWRLARFSSGGLSRVPDGDPGTPWRHEDPIPEVQRWMLAQGHRRAFLAEDAATREDLAGRGPDGGAPGTFLAIPLFHEGEDFGLLIGASAAPARVHLGSDRIHGLESLGASAGLALQRIRAARSLEESERRLRAVFDALPDGVAVHADGRILYANRAFARIFGLPSGDIAGRPVLDILPEGERRRLRAMGGWVAEGLVEAFGRRSDGKEFPMEVTTVGHVFQGRPARLSVFRDTSERKVILDLLRDSESRYRSLFEHNLAGVFRTDLDGNVYDCNDACASILGFASRSELMACEAKDLYFEPQERERFLEELRVRGFLANHELCLRRKDGGTVWVLENVTLSQPGADLPPVIEGTLIDITERKLVERLEQEQAELLEMVAQSLPLESVLDHLARMVDHQIVGLACLVLHRQQGGLRLAAAPSLPPSLLPRLPEAGLEAALQRSPADPAAPAWAPYRALLESSGLRISSAAPIVSAMGEPLGLVVFHRPEGPANGSKAERDLLAAAVRLAALAIEHAQLSERLVHQAQYDALTGLPNRLLFQDRLSQALHAARRHGGRLAVMFIDLDGFKRVNDSLGHQAGDLLLTQVAARFRKVVRSSDTLARMGGDEFMVVLVDARDTRASVRVAEKLLACLREPFLVAGHELVITASIGISFFPEDGTEQDDLQRHADAAMYQAKAGGRDGFQCYTPKLNAQIMSRLEMEQQLRQALARGEIFLAYQPQHLADGRLAGFEALLRWNHPRLGAVPPARFIPVAEECGLILSLGKWALEEACRQCARWREEGHAEVRVAVNVSAAQFEQPDWNRTVARVLESTRLPAQALELEITEGLVMKDAAEASRKLRAMREMGVSLAIDDFGTGYSSLAYLQRLPIDTLKIDQSFVRGIEPGGGLRDSTAIVETIVNLGRGLGLSVLAEGVETEAQCTFLRRIGCDAMQGYLFSRPLEREAATGYLRSEAARAR
jgi:diguanylate cyclase (GGDEF)-like protein/PAS domain S-box-containing protein